MILYFQQVNGNIILSYLKKKPLMTTGISGLLINQTIMQLVLSCCVVSPYTEKIYTK